MRVLVVDDEKPCLDELVYILSNQGNVEIAGAFTSPMEALEALPKLNFDVAFLDICMPHISGAELAGRLLEYNPYLKVVYVTAYTKELIKLRNNTVFGTLLKPVSDAKLRDLLQRLSV